MSRLPTLSTPGRSVTPPSTGLPTPTHRRPRSSLGPNSTPHLVTTPDEAMNRALQEALRSRPPSSLRGKEIEGDPDTPTQPLSHFSLCISNGLAAPRTPALRPRTPSALGIAHPTTPITSRNGRPPVTARSSMASSTAGGNPFTPRRVSVASSTNSTTPYARRPESRASNAHDIGTTPWMPTVGERVRMSGLGMEGTLRFVGSTQFKDGVWAGVELEGGFSGKGKNDGSVDGVEYFTCPAQCGVFVLASKLSPPTSGPSRPSSVASSHRSLASPNASYSLHGRATPSFDNQVSRPATTTPARASRAVSYSVKGRLGLLDHQIDSPLDGQRPVRTMLGNSTSSNVIMAESQITAGSRASKYVGMTAKQLNDARAVPKSLTAGTTTPKPSRVSMGGATPARSGRQSIGGSFVTPKARAPRPSTAMDVMPPPPSPGKINRAMQAHQAQVEEEIRELKRRNATLEVELRTFGGEDERRRIEALRLEVDRVKVESDSLRHQLSASQADAADASRLAEELQDAQGESKEEIAAKEKALVRLQKEMKLAAERAAGELEAGMEAKRAEVKKMQIRAERAEAEGSEMRTLVEELTHAGQATISLYETKQYDLEDRIRTLEDRNRSLDEKVQKAREENEKVPVPVSPTARVSAAEIDNETLNAQLKHLQNKLDHLEEELEEARAQAEADVESWKAKLTKSRDGERAVMEQVASLKMEISKLNEQAGGAKGRIAELEGALKENQVALEAARADIEGLRVEAAEASSMRAALQSAAVTEKALSLAEAELSKLKLEMVDAKVTEVRAVDLAAKVTILETEINSLNAESANAKEADHQAADLTAKIITLESEITSLKQAATSHIQNGFPTPSTPTNREPRPRMSTGSASDDPEKKLRGFQHIIQEMSAENADLKEKYQSVLEEVGLLKEEVKLLEETSDVSNGGDRPNGIAISTKEMLEAKASVAAHVQTIKELNREVSELESLVESKIYREDELETRLIELERQIKAAHAHPQPEPTGNSSHSHSRTSSMHTSNTAEDRCELCEGPHDLDACPVFAGNTLGGVGIDGKPSPVAGRGKSGKYCADCESTAHDTVDCPLAEDVF